MNLNSQESITTIYGDEGGFFTSSTSTVNTYNDSNNLLGFISGGITYSTGVNDAILTNNTVSFTPGNFSAFPVPGTIINPGSTLIGIGTNWGGVAQDNSATDFIKTFSPIVPSYFLRDGSNGLELASNYFNIPVQTITYDAAVINDVSKINDAEPDIIVTQTGQPGNTDTFKFADSSGTTVGVELDVVFAGVSRVGITKWTIYRVDPSTGLVTSTFAIDSPRDLRLISFKLSDFGITTGNFSDVTNFLHTTSGNTDIAFTAYNTAILKIDAQDTEIAVSNSSFSADDLCAPSTLTFVSTITNNALVDAQDFEVAFSLPAGVSSTTSSFSLSGGSEILTYSGTENKWIISGLDAGESVTLTVNATASGVFFPLDFTVTANLSFQVDTNINNNTETVTETGNCKIDLSLKKTVDKGILRFGEIVTFKIELKNEGVLTATGVLVRDLLPAGLIYNAAVSTIPANTTYNPGTGIWDLTAISITNNQTIELKIAATINTIGAIIINQSEVISSNETDVDSTPNNNN